MSYIIRTAAVTQKSANKEFNGDNLNLNGKVLSMENADKGFKGAGSMSVPFAVAFATSEYNGFAGAALTALNDRLADLKEDENGFASILDGYFADSKSALEKCGCDSNGLSTALFVGYENKIVAAKMGAVCILRYADGDLVKVGGVPQGETDATPAGSYEIISEVNNADLYVLCSADVLDSLTEGEIIVALNAADGNEKKAVQMLASKYAKRRPDSNVTFTVIRVVKEEEVPAAPAAAIPVVQPEEPVYDEPQAEENVYEPESEEAEEEPVDPRKKILIWSVLSVALLLIMAVTVFAAYKIAYSRNHSDVAAGVVASGGSAQYDVNAEQTSEEPTSEAATEAATSESASEAATEEATQEDTTEEDEDDYYYDDDDDDDYYYDDDDDDNNGYYDDEEEDPTTVEPVTPPVVESDPTEAPTEAPTDPPVDTPVDEPDDGGNEDETPSILYPAPDDENDTFDPD